MKENYIFILFISLLFIVSCSSYYLFADRMLLVYEYPDENHVLVFSKNLRFRSPPQELGTAAHSEPEMYHIFYGDSLAKLNSLPVQPDTVLKQTIEDSVYTIFRYFPKVELGSVKYLDVFVREEKVKFIKVKEVYK